MNKKRNFVEKITEKIYNNLNEKQNKKVSTKINDENNSLGRLNEDVDNTSFSLLLLQCKLYKSKKFIV